MADISTLVKDIYRVLDKGAEVSPEATEKFGVTLSKIMSERLSEPRERTPHLRMSNLGTDCDRELWLKINKPEVQEALPPSTRMKFLFGDVIEALLFFLADVAGHRVEGEQDEVMINGVKGHRDGVIDGMIVDAKSASTFSFKKFFNGLKPEDDAFGYLRQIGGYLHAGQDDPLVKNKHQAAFLVTDKTLGHITLDIHNKDDVDYEALVEAKKTMLDGPMPPRGYSDQPDGASGNRKLGIKCSYCPVKRYCWPGLRTFAYSNGLRHLTVVKREPNVDEIK